jgi:hypothetical protein
VRFLAIGFVGLLAIGGACQTAPQPPLLVEPGVVERRSLQSRTYEGWSETEVQRACVSLLQDLGFCVDETEPDLGMLLASKERDAKEAGQYLMKVVGWGLGFDPPVETRQQMCASVITISEGESDDSIEVRVTFQRLVWNDYRQISRRELLDDPRFYQEFFERLSRALLLEGTAS